MGTSIESLLQHRDWVRRVARALVSTEAEAEDLEQEAWLRAVARPPASEGGAKAWFRTVLRRVARDRWRTRSRREDRESRIEPTSPTAPTADLVAEAEAHRLVVNAALALPEPYREAIVLRYFHELPASEIAERLDVPLETVRTRVKRAIARLRDGLDGRHGGDRKAWLGVVALLLPATAKAGTAVKAGLVVTAAAAVLATVLVWPGGEGKPPRKDPVPIVAAAPEIVEEPAVMAEIPPEPERVEVAATDAGGEGEDLEAPPPPPPPPALVVVVVDHRARPIPGAQVTIHPMRPRAEIIRAIRKEPWPFSWIEPLPVFCRGKTDPSGEVAIPELPGDWLHLRIAAEGYVPFANHVEARDRRSQVVLQPATELIGTVRLRAGTPIEGAVVTCGYLHPQRTAPTDSRGAWKLGGVPVGPARLSAELPWGMVVVSPTIDTRRVRRYDFVLDHRAALRGRVVDRRTGTGIGEARVVAQVAGPGWSRVLCAATTTTAADGRYSFDRLPRGRLTTLRVSAEGYLPGSYDGHPYTESLPGGRPVVRDFRLDRGAIVRGEVRFQTGEPVPGATVHLGVPDWDDDFRVVTDRRGRFLIPAVRPGVGRFHVSGPGFYFPEGQRNWRVAMAPASMRVVVPETGEVRKILHVSRGAVVEGEVRRTDGTPCPGVKVVARPYRGTIAVTDSLGRFRLSGVPPGDAVSVRELGSLGVLGQSEPFRVGENEVVTGIVVVHRDEAATGISGRIHVVRASLPEDVRLFITGGQSRHWDHASPVPVAPDGSFRIECRRSGDHTLIAVAGGYGDAIVFVEDLAIEEFREGVTVRLFPAESISGRVVGKGGEFVAGAGIHVIPLDEDRPRLDGGPIGPLNTWTGESGRFTIEGLAPGRYRVSVDRPGMTGIVVVASAGDGDVLLETRPGRVIGGILLDADTGKPVAGVSVCAIPRARATSTSEDRWFTKSGPDGRFLLDGLNDGLHSLRIAYVRHARPEDPEYVQQGRDVRAGAQNLKIYVVPGAVIEGRVLGGDRKPLGHIRVASRRSRQSTWTNHDGTFRLARLQPGKHDLHIYDQDDRGLVAIRKKGVPAGTRDLLFVMESGPSISGRVLDPDGNAPSGRRGSVGFSVSGANRFRTFRLEKDGTFRSPPLKEGTVYDLRARGFDDTIGVVVRRIRAGETRVHLRLIRGGTISGRVVDENGDPAPGGIFVSAYADGARGSVVPQGDMPKTYTKEDGTFVLRGVGDFTFRVIAAVSGSGGYLGVRTEAAKRVRPGTKDLGLRVVRGVPFHGRLVDPQGRPVSCELQRWQHNGSGNIGIGGRSSDEGRFRWSCVRPGPLRLVAVIGGRKVECLSHHYH
ncbi:MAG: sigma-70 family RNA polymerase sigma factor, partial [Planctomycetota bacterium]